MVNSSRVSLLFIINIIFILSVFTNHMNAQTIERQLIGSMGQLSKTTNYNFSSTSGEVVIFTNSSENTILTNGFQQPLAKEFVGSININNVKIDYSVYPNPTKELINLSITTSDFTDFSIGIIDVLGKTTIPSRKYKTHGTISETFSLNKFPAGTYFLIIRDKKGAVIKHFKIQKSN